MPLFEFDDGRLIPAQFGRSVHDGLTGDILKSVREQVLEIVGRPLFPITWQDSAPVGSGMDGGTPRLTALDASGQVVSVEVLEQLDSAAMIDSLSRLADTASLGWNDLAAAYPGGIQGFRVGWTEFRDAMPPSPAPGPRLVLVVGAIANSVRPALDVLASSGVEVHEIAVRVMSNGRKFLDVQAVGPRLYGHNPNLLMGRTTQTMELTAFSSTDQIASGRHVDPTAEADLPEDPTFDGTSDFDQPEDLMYEDAAEEPYSPPTAEPAEVTEDETAGEHLDGEPGEESAADFAGGFVEEPAPEELEDSATEGEPFEYSEEPVEPHEEFDGVEEPAEHDEFEDHAQPAELADEDRADVDHAYEQPEIAATPELVEESVLAEEVEEAPESEPVPETDAAVHAEHAEEPEEADAQPEEPLAEPADDQAEEPEVDDEIPQLTQSAEAMHVIGQILGQDTPLVWQQTEEDTHEAVLTSEGEIRTQMWSTGDPTEAAAMIAGSSQFNGWDVWHLGDAKGPSLREALEEINREIRDEYENVGSPRRGRRSRHRG